jgi:predicted DNA-binding transcriptional regulator YafY
MQISRLFEIIYILLERGTVSARELSERFEVSVRTVYRDVEHLSTSGIPVYMAKGRNGGIRLLPNFVLDKTVLTKKEKDEILASLAGLSATGRQEADEALQKLAPLFGQSDCNWIEVDFNGWSWGETLRERFSLIKDAILIRQPLSFTYYGTSGEQTTRVIEPLRLVFRGQAWYVYGYCRTRGEDRFFKLTRMEDIVRLDELFTRTAPEKITRPALPQPSLAKLEVVFKAHPSMAYRIYDEYPHNCIRKEPDGSLVVSVKLTEGEWLLPYLVSYGEHIELLEPANLRQELCTKLETLLLRFRQTS